MAGLTRSMPLRVASRGRSGSGGIRQRLLTLRDRLLSDPRFQRWAAGFPLTRPVARRKARTLFDLCAGFVYSQILFACVELGLIEALSGGPCDRATLRDRLGLSEDAAHRLLESAAALDLIERRGPDLYGLGQLGAAMLGNPGIAAMVEHHRLLYADLRDPVALLRGELSSTALGAYWPYAKGDTPSDLTGADVAPYSRLMAESQAFVAAEVLDAYPFGRHRTLLDIGGGDGVFLGAAAIRHPSLKLVLFDLPSVVELAKARLDAAGLADRLSVHGGDFFKDPLPQGADVVSLVRIIHDHDDEAALAILRAARAALPDGGTLVLAEPFADTAGAESVGAYFNFYLLAMGSGRPRTRGDLLHFLDLAGFRDVRAVRTRSPMLTSLLTARR